MSRRSASILESTALAAGLLALFVACGGLPPATGTSPPQAEASLSLRAQYRALWWSPRQMEGLDPDAPPPKETEVALERWEYTDPIGVPHPDAVDLVVALTNRGSEPLEVTLRAEQRWREGPLEDEARAAWTETEPLGEQGPIHLAPGSAHEARFAAIDLRSHQTGLYAVERWPFELEVRIEARPSGSEGAAALVETVARLPMLPGD